jgi:uncharacterized protein (TIGR02453 family)
MKTGFPGFTPEALKFLAALKKNNKREWFQPRKQKFDDHWKTPMTELVAALNDQMLRFAPDYVHDPAKAVLRIYRDTRFSKDKTPYKTHVAAVLRRHGLSKDGSAQVYFHVDPTEVVMAAGIYTPSPDELRAVRAFLAEEHARFTKLAKGAKFAGLWGKLQGEQLSRTPKGYLPGHPAEDLLRRKQFYFAVRLESKVATTPALFKEVLSRFQAAAPVLEFLNTPLAGLARADEGRFLRDI